MTTTFWSLSWVFGRDITQSIDSYTGNINILWPENKTELYSIPERYTSAELHSIKVKFWLNIIQIEILQKFKFTEVRRISNWRFRINTLYKTGIQNDIQWKQISFIKPMKRFNSVLTTDTCTITTISSFMRSIRLFMQELLMSNLQVYNRTLQGCFKSGELCFKNIFFNSLRELIVHSRKSSSQNSYCWEHIVWMRDFFWKQITGTSIVIIV